MKPLLIAHRGLTAGPDADRENHPDQLQAALDSGYDAEIDLWLLDGDQWWLGHDEPTYKTDIGWVWQRKDRFWIHCKNLQAFFQLRNIASTFNAFWHDTDLVVLTMQNYVWTYLGKPETEYHHAICVMPEMTYDWPTIEHMVQHSRWHGFCSDHVDRLRGWLA